MRKALLVLVLVLLLCTGCGSAIYSIDRQRVAPGETFTIHGRRLTDDLDSPPRVPPVLDRCGELPLEVLQWHVDRLVVRVPQNVPAAVYDVHAFGVPLGAFSRPRTNGKALWVTAAPVDASITDPYEVQVRSFRTRYGKSAEWQAWMLANRSRHENAFNLAHAVPCPVKIAVSYHAPIPYSPPWTSVDQHMTLLETAANGAFAGYNFDFRESYTPAEAYAQAILGTPDSNAGGRVMRLHFETILNHEFGHIVGALHHYGDLDTVGDGLNFPPGESGCVMDRNRSEYCSACRTGLNIPLEANNAATIDAALSAILTRYPPGW